MNGLMPRGDIRGDTGGYIGEWFTSCVECSTRYSRDRGSRRCQYSTINMRYEWQLQDRSDSKESDVNKAVHTNAHGNITV
jgi:hypothetical protein